MTLSSSMNIVSQALAVNQAALNVVSNNIANVDTEGYSKQTVNLETVAVHGQISSALTQALSGAGVALSSVTRSSNNYLQEYYRSSNSQYNYLNTATSIASSVEDVTNELNSGGLSTAYAAFYDAAGDVSSDPDSLSAREVYVQAAQTLAQTFNSFATSLSAIETSMVGTGANDGSIDDSKLSLQVDKVNNLLKSLADTNKAIVETSSANLSSNNLLDKRDSILKELSSYVDINTTLTAGETATVTIAGVEVVKGSDFKYQLDAVPGSLVPGATDNAVIQLVDKEGNVKITNANDKITSGSIGAVLDLCGSNTTTSGFTIDGVMKSLDTLASGFAKEINDLQVGVNAKGTAMSLTKNAVTGDLELTASTESMFLNSATATTAGITAANISVNTDILNNPYEVAAARLLDVTKVTSVGDNANIASIIKTRTTSSADIGNTTPETYVANIAGEVGLDVESFSTSLKTQSNVMSSVKAQLSSETGVSLDQELMDLMKYQQAYQAAARVFAVCNELMDTLMNLGQ